ncbi:hypothetical protein SKAU_G00075350 [Synaphobranchus kaupii]|uniref:E3 ubiquitin-protein ligase n=1 Tax=Synaphobranchus kaupii TaxID=118154 RepID=A0A9Q1G963_SYNKA|nr:hypothetical protein SKAU_G00075350 [Synaphobranchus kaupii]
MSKLSKAGSAVGIYGCFTETGEPSEARATAAEVGTCPLCMEPLQKKQRLICTHAFCAACLERSVERVGLQCPVCLKALRVVGDQPQGEMSVKHLKDCFGKECVCIVYNILSGIQTEAHPNPGKPFTGIQTEAWLPDKQWIRSSYGSGTVCLDGQNVLKLLQRAFEQKLVFTVAATDGAADRVVFTDIPHARNFYECIVTARTERQKQLGSTQSKFQQRIQEREKELQDLRQAVQSLKHSAQAAVEDSERIFTEVKELIRVQEKAEVSRAEGLLERLEQEIAELRRRDAELEQLSHTEDHIHFLQSSKSLCVPPGPGALPSIKPLFSFESVRKCVSELKERLEDVCKGEMSKISKAGRVVVVSRCLKIAKATAAKVQTCPLCMQPLYNKQRLICTHAFCADCLKCSVQRLGPQCPVCLKALRVVGDQPEGQMTVKHLKDCFGKECFCIMYNIPSGIQTEAHPNPGKPFTGIQTEAWLPDEEVVTRNNFHSSWLDGQEVLKLLQRAFEQKLVFTVSLRYPAAEGPAYRVVFNDIPHARNLYECREDGFLHKVRAALKVKFIK